MKRFPVKSLLLLGSLLANTSVQAEQTWHLMSRHGECTDITATLRHMLGDFPAVNNPEALLQALKDRGLDAEPGNLSSSTEGLLLIRVPAKNWSLLVIRRDRCTGFSTGPK